MGVGKTWMAREVAADLKGSSYGTLWMVLGKKYEERAFLKNIAFQLSVFPSNEDWEEDDKNAEMEQQEGKAYTESLKQRILDKLKLMKPAKLEETEAAKSDGKKSGNPGQKAPAKTEAEKTKPYEIKPLSNADSSNLLNNRVKREVSGATGFKRLSDAIGSSGLSRPGVIIMIAEALNHVEDSKLADTIEEAASVVESADITRLLQYVDDMLPSSLTKCCWHCRYLFRYLFPERRGIHYSELITHWLLEGYFDNHDHIEKAYEEAHCTLMELKDRGLLRETEDGYVYMESDALGVTDHRPDGLSRSACVGLACVLNDHTWAGLGRVIQTDGMVKTSSGRRSEMSTVLIDGARFCREVPGTIFPTT
ncbi:hypothetical protein NL676_007876 [Syzygium grande]|nr:hypothetical protein NL676_007876 [Syzygium grande]